MNDNSNPRERAARRQIAKLTAMRVRLQDIVLDRQGELDSFERLMQGEYSSPLCHRRNHLDRWEMAEVERVNRWRGNCDRLQAPTPSMYEAEGLMRYCCDFDNVADR
jgi:hypothetical protein